MSIMGGFASSGGQSVCTADHDSYVEGIVRGYRNGLLTGAAYNNLTQCETIDGMMMILIALHLYCCAFLAR